MRVDLRHAVRRAGVERRLLVLRDLEHLAEHLRGRSLVEADAGIDAADRLEQARDPDRGELGGQDRLLPGGGHEALRAEVVDLGRARLLERLGERRRIEQVGLDERDPVGQMVDPLEVLGRGAADHPEHLVTLVEEEIGQVGAVLAGDAGDQRPLAHVLAILSAAAERAKSSASASVCSSGIVGAQPVAACRREGSPEITVRSLGRLRAGSGSTWIGQLRHADEQVEDLAQLDDPPGRDVVRLRRNGGIEEELVGPADVAHVRDVALRGEIADEHRPSAGLLGAGDLSRPGADREALVAPRALVLKRAGDDHVEPRAARKPAGELGSRLRGGVLRDRRDGSILRRRDLLGPPVDLARRDDQDPRVRRMRARRLQEIDGADDVHAPGLSRVLGRGRHGGDRGQVHDRAGRARVHRFGEARRIGDVHVGRQRSLPELVNQDGAREALRPGDEYRPSR